MSALSIWISAAPKCPLLIEDDTDVAEPPEDPAHPANSKGNTKVTPVSKYLFLMTHSVALRNGTVNATASDRKKDHRGERQSHRDPLLERDRLAQEEKEQEQRDGRIECRDNSDRRRIAARESDQKKK